MTAQFHERLILDGVETTLACTPSLPYGHERFEEIEPEHWAHDDETRHILYSTGCWRRYQGSWAIKQGRLYLVGLRGCFRLIGDQPLLAEWYSGILRVPQGKVWQYVHMGFETLYEQELFIEIEHGLVVRYWLIDNRRQRAGKGKRK